MGKKILEEGGIKGIVSEDKFNNVPVQKFRVRARFRINVEDEDLDRALNFLAKILRKTRLA